MEHAVANMGLIVGLSAAAGLVAFIVADILKVPAILFYLLLGVAFGPWGLDMMPQEELRVALPHVVPLLAAIILFEGGLSLDIDAIRQATRSLQRILTVGAGINLIGGTLAAHFIGGLPAGSSLIFGALMTVTGPTVIMPILRRTPLVPRVRALLHWEGILIDPIGVVLGVLALEFVLETVGVNPIANLVTQLAFGSTAGVFVGMATAAVLQHPFFHVGHERANLGALAAAMVAFSAGEAVVHEGGIVSATVAGLVLGTRHFPQLEGIKEFKEQVTTLLVASLFVVLAASVDPSHAVALGWRGAAAVAVVALVVRPIAIFTCTYDSDLSWQEKVTIAWIGPRGIIAAAVASLAAIKLQEQGMEGGDALQGLVFAAIFGTVVVQGLSAGFVSRLLGVADADTGGVLLAAGALGPEVGLALKEQGVNVVIIDDNQNHLDRAAASGLDVHHGSVVDRQVVEDLYDQSEVEMMVAMSPEPFLNTVAAQVGAEVFGKDRSYRIAVSRRGIEVVPPFGDRDTIAFLGPLDVERVATEVRENLAFVGTRVFETSGVLDSPGGVYPLFLVRDCCAEVIVKGTRYQAGDRLIFFEREVTMEERPPSEGLPEDQGETQAQSV